mgnify:CR=1 FL=1
MRFIFRSSRRGFVAISRCRFVFGDSWFWWFGLWLGQEGSSRRDIRDEVLEVNKALSSSKIRRSGLA